MEREYASPENEKGYASCAKKLGKGGKDVSDIT
jgi:hypothetical protein